MALIDLLRFFIPVSAIIAVFWCVSFIARISEPKPFVSGADDNTEFRLHWIYKISVVVIGYYLFIGCYILDMGIDNVRS